jgi:1,4-dihydroxy-2-naphthoate octaprenyltransferase
MGQPAAARLAGLLLLGSYGLLGSAIWVGWLPTWTAIALAPLPAAVWVSTRLRGALSNPAQLNTLLGINVAVLLATLALLICGLSL